ncbi:MAG: NADH-quinone oxidoreductase subunit NuoK [Candidatus Methanosuratincola sp.]
MSEVFSAAALVLFFIGLYCVVTRRNMIKTVLGIEIMTSAVNLNFISYASSGAGADPLGTSIVIVSISVGAAVAALALSMVIAVYRKTGSVDVRELRRLKW